MSKRIEVILYTDDSGANAAHQIEGYELASLRAIVPLRKHDLACEVAELIRATLHDCDLRYILGYAARGELTAEVDSDDSDAIRIAWVYGDDYMMMAIVKVLA